MTERPPDESRSSDQAPLTQAPITPPTEARAAAGSPPAYAPPYEPPYEPSAYPAPTTEATYAPPSYPPPSYAQQSYAQPTEVQPSYQAPSYGTAPYGTAPYGTASYGSGSYGSSTYPPGYSQPTQRIQPTYGAPGYGHPGYGQPTPPPSYPTSYTTPSAGGPKRSGGGTARTALIAAAVALVVGGGVGAATAAAVDHNGHTVATGISFSTAAAPNPAKIDGSVTAAAAKIQPSVVTINVAGSSESGTGSGIVLNDNGDIVTNDHVVAVAGSSGQIQVITQDGQSAMATIVGVDQSDDLAVIKVSGLSNLVKADFAPSSALQVGQTVVAVGAPLGLSNTVTSGIVSNTSRPVQTGDSTSTATATFDAIQTDAAINPGNSGGPLVNLNGDVVGINAAIATADSGGLQVPGQTQQSGSIGIGFAIPSDEASRIAGELIANGKATHAVIGVSVADSSSQQTSIQTTVGATISAVTADGPAAKAGIAVGDIVTKAQNQLIVTGTDLVAAIRSFAPGQTITLTYQRAGATHTTQITLGTATAS